MDLYSLVFSDRRRERFRRHLLFWLVWCIYWLTTYLIPTHWIPGWNLYGPKPQIEQYGFVISFFRLLMNSILMTMIYMGLTYGILYYILPRYMAKNKNWLTTTGILLLFVSIIALINYLFFIMVFSISTRLGYFTTMPDMNFIIPIWSRQILFNYPTVISFAVAIKLLKNWYTKQKETEQVAREKFQAELQILKAQVHPHFLFNTINNIYSFILNGSGAAPQMVTKLSGLLRYIIYECNAPMVNLEKELKMIRDYMALEKIRYGDNLNMSLQIQGDPAHKMIYPLLLIPFLENSFKHGTSRMLTHPWINLDIIMEGNILHFKLSNSKPGIEPESTLAKGIGLNNVKKRLALHYPGTHSLNISEDILSFNVALKIDLLIPDKKQYGNESIIENLSYELA